MSDRVITRNFDTIGEFLDHIDTPEHRRHVSGGYAGAWGGTWAGAIRHARNGNPSCNDEINALVDKVQCELPSTQDVWTPDVAGVCPIVPAAIAGLPDNMLRLDQQETSGVPLRIFVSLCLSGGCDNHVIRKRGIAINALLQALSARRPTELMLFGDMGGRGYLVTPVIRIQSMPLDQSTLTGALTDEQFLRQLLFAFAHANSNWHGGWAWDTPPNYGDAHKRTRAAMGANSEDLLILGAYLSESDLIIRDPLAWVQQQVALTEKTAKGEE